MTEWKIVVKLEMKFNANFLYTLDGFFKKKMLQNMKDHLDFKGHLFCFIAHDIIKKKSKNLRIVIGYCFWVFC